MKLKPKWKITRFGNPYAIHRGRKVAPVWVWTDKKLAQKICNMMNKEGWE